MGAWSGSTNSGPCLSQALTVRCPSSCFLSIASIFTSLYELRPHYLLETCSKPKGTYFLPKWLVCWNILKTTFDGKDMLKSSVFHVITNQHWLQLWFGFRPHPKPRFEALHLWDASRCLHWARCEVRLVMETWVYLCVYIIIHMHRFLVYISYQHTCSYTCIDNQLNTWINQKSCRIKLPIIWIESPEKWVGGRKVHIQWGNSPSRTSNHTIQSVHIRNWSNPQGISGDLTDFGQDFMVEVFAGIIPFFTLEQGTDLTYFVYLLKHVESMNQSSTGTAIPAVYRICKQYPSCPFLLVTNWHPETETCRSRWFIAPLYCC